MIVDCVSDLHGFYPKLEGGDLLIIGGDLTAQSDLAEYFRFFSWIAKSRYKKKVVIAGNHDNLLCSDPWYAKMNADFEYLSDSGIEFEGLKIWGSPWTTTFPGINPHCCAFTKSKDEDLAQKWALIPTDVDILVTHSPAYGILDKTDRGERVGSKTLQMELFNRLRPKLFVCGHIHEAYGTEPPGGFVEKAINVSYVNEKYKPVNKPIRIII